jgi:RNA polymerase sigma-70 factor (ECF subfamily)
VRVIEEIFSRHHAAVYRVCMLYMKNTADAEDMTQNTFLKMMEKAPVFASSEHEKAWLVRTAVNLCKNDLRSFRRKTAELPETLAAKETGADETLRLVFALPKKYRTPLYLHYYEGYSAVEIARMLKTRESTVRSWLMRGREMLRMELDDNG